MRLRLMRPISATIDQLSAAAPLPTACFQFT
jgi:hypothetical protein